MMGQTDDDGVVHLQLLLGIFSHHHSIVNCMSALIAEQMPADSVAICNLWMWQGRCFNNNIIYYY